MNFLYIEAKKPRTLPAGQRGKQAQQTKFLSIVSCVTSFVGMCFIQGNVFSADCQFCVLWGSVVEYFFFCNRNSRLNIYACGKVYSCTLRKAAKCFIMRTNVHKTLEA